MRKKLFTIFVAVWLCVMICPQFGTFVTVRADPPVTQVDVMLDYGNGTVKWYANANVIGVATVFEATQAVATLNYSWWGDDVFVDAINGVWNNLTTNYYWLYWYWNSTSGSWNYGPVACNKYPLNNGDVIAWYYETAPWGPPSTTGACARSDINGDGIVNINDVVIAALAFGSCPGHPRWNPIADIRQDGIINIIDLVMIGVNFGKAL